MFLFKTANNIIIITTEHAATEYSRNYVQINTIVTWELIKENCNSSCGMPKHSALFQLWDAQTR